MSVGDLMRAYRAMSGTRLVQLNQGSGISLPRIREIELEEGDPPTRRELLLIAGHMYGLPQDHLVKRAADVEAQWDNMHELLGEILDGS